MIFIIGTGNVFAETPPTYLYNGNPNSLAAALQQQEKTPKMAFYLIDLFDVPSKSIIIWSITCSKTDVPKSSSAIMVLTFSLHLKLLS
jgi:hypothetical protein